MGDDGNRAELKLGASGQEEVIRAAEDIRSAYVKTADQVGGAFGSLGTRMRGAVGGAITEVGRSFSTLAQDSIRLATAFNNISLAGAVGSARQLDDALSRIVVSKQVPLAELRSKLASTSKSILVGEPQIAAEAQALSALTGSFRDAIGEMQGLGEEALATGKSSEAMVPLGAVLHNVLGVAGDTEQAIGKIRAQAESLRTVGGPAALESQLAGLTGIIDHFSARTDDARNRLTGLVGLLGRGLNPGAAGRVQSTVLGGLEGNSLEINRTLGRDILDSQGHVQDPARVLSDLQSSMGRRGITGQRALLAWRRMFGNEAGSQVYGLMQSGALSPGAIAHLAGLAPSSSGAAAADAFRGSTSGQRLGVQLANERAARSAAEPLLDAQNAWGQFFSGSPVASAVAGTMLASVGTSLAKGMGGMAARLGGMVAGGGGAAAAAAAEGGSVGAALAGTATAATSAAVAMAPFAVALAAATPVIAAIAAYKERPSEDDPNKHLNDRDKTNSGRFRKTVTQSAGFMWGIGDVDQDVEKPEVGAIIRQAGGGDKLAPNENFAVDHDRNLADLRAVANLGHMPTRRDLQVHPELVAIWDRLPKEIADRLAEALRRGQAQPTVVPDPNHPTKVVTTHKGQRGAFHSSIHASSNHGG